MGISGNSFGAAITAVLPGHRINDRSLHSPPCGLLPRPRPLPVTPRQTGQQCAACHNGFPELTPYGRLFKLNGYTFGGGTSPYPPIAAMASQNLGAFMQVTYDALGLADRSPGTIRISATRARPTCSAPKPF